MKANNVFNDIKRLMCITDFKIRKRHDYLTNTFGTKDVENKSYNRLNTLVISVTVCMTAFCALETAAYYVYNRWVSN